VTFVLFLISVLVLEVIVGPRPKRSVPQAPPRIEPESSPPPSADLLALNTALEGALEAARGSAPSLGMAPDPARDRAKVAPCQPEYNETDVRAE